MPEVSTMKPEPSELVLRGCRSLPLSPPLEPPPGPLRFLKKSSKNSSNGEPGGNCGIAPLSPPPPPLLASTVCEVEMLTTASITFSATSAMPSGPRANAGTALSMLTAPSVIAAPIRRRRRLKAGLAPGRSANLQRVDLASTVRPNGSAAQAFEPDISAKNRLFRSHDSVDSAANFSLWPGIAVKRPARFRPPCPVIHVVGDTRKKDVDARDIQREDALRALRDTVGKNSSASRTRSGPSPRPPIRCRRRATYCPASPARFSWPGASRPGSLRTSVLPAQTRFLHR